VFSALFSDTLLAQEDKSGGVHLERTLHPHLVQSADLGVNLLWQRGDFNATLLEKT